MGSKAGYIRSLMGNNLNGALSLANEPLRLPLLVLCSCGFPYMVDRDMDGNVLWEQLLANGYHGMEHGQFHHGFYPLVI